MKPRNPDGTVNYAYLDMGRWWDKPSWQLSHALRGFVRDERFGGGQVIAGTNRAKTKHAAAIVQRERARQETAW